MGSSIVECYNQRKISCVLYKTLKKIQIFTYVQYILPHSDDYSLCFCGTEQSACLFNMTSINTYSYCGDIFLSFPEWKKKELRQQVSLPYQRNMLKFTELINCRSEVEHRAPDFHKRFFFYQRLPQSQSTCIENC